MANWMLPFPDSKKTGYFGKIRTFKGAPKNPHRGTDWGVASGTPIPAVTDGKIMLVQYSKVLGWVIVQSAKDSAGKIWYVGYCHLKNEPKLKKADRVKCGDTVGLIGNTGSASSGPHLHATLSDSVKGVFYGNVFDLHKKILEELGGKPSPVAKASEPAKVEVKKEEPKSDAKSHTVVPGDTLGAIANKYGFTVQELAQHNNIANPSLISVGQVINFPVEEKKPEPPKVCETCKRPL